MVNKQTKTVLVSLELADMVNKLDEALKAEFGGDYAYTVMAKGVFIKLKTFNHLHDINPTVKPLKLRGNRIVEDAIDDDSWPEDLTT